jgi:hypothetical protein
LAIPASDVKGDGAQGCTGGDYLARAGRQTGEWRKVRDVVIRAYERILEKYAARKAAEDAQERLDS